MPSSANGHESALHTATLFSTVQPVPPVRSTGTPHLVQQALNPDMFPFAACATINLGAPSTLRRSHRRRTPLVRLSSLSILPMTNINPHPTMPSGRTTPPPPAERFPHKRRARYNELRRCTRCLRALRLENDARLLQPSSWEDGVCRTPGGGREERDVYGNCCGARSPLACRDRHPVREATA